MRPFEVCLQSAEQSETFQNVVSFVGEDASGQFGLLGHHARMMTCLIYGLATLRYVTDEIDYLAVPSGLLYFRNNRLVISTRHYIRNKDYNIILGALDKTFQIEEQNLSRIKDSLHRLDESMLKRLFELKRQGHYES